MCSGVPCTWGAALQPLLGLSPQRWRHIPQIQGSVLQERPVSDAHGFPLTGRESGGGPRVPSFGPLNLQGWPQDSGMCLLPGPAAAPRALRVDEGMWSVVPTMKLLGSVSSCVGLVHAQVLMAVLT